MAKIGYLRAYKKKEIEEFEALCKVDNVMCDVLDDMGYQKDSYEFTSITEKERAMLRVWSSNNLEFDKVISVVKNRDKLVIKSIANACRDIKDLEVLINTCMEKGVELISLEDGDLGALLKPDGRETLSIINNFACIKLNTILYADIKLGRKIARYPEKFMDVYRRFRSGSINRVQAIEELQVTQATFYNLIRGFEN